MGLELPHLTLFWRRYRRSWWRSWLAALLVWGGLSLARHEFGYLVPWLSASSISEELIILSGNFIVYLILAQAMAPLACEPYIFGLSSARRKEGGDRTPLWLASPLESWRAVLGCLAAGLIACVPFVLGLICYILAAVSVERQIGAPIFWANLWVSNLRLPHLALAAACILLAFRHSILAPYLPALIAACAMLSAQCNIVSQGFFSLSDAPLGLPEDLVGLPLGAQVLLQGMLLLLGLMYALWWIAGRSEGASNIESSYRLAALPLLVIAGLFILPVLLGSTAFGISVTGAGFELLELFDPAWTVPLHSMLFHIYPDIYVIDYNPFGSFLANGGGTGAHYSLYGTSISITSSRNLLLELLLVSMAFWTFCALACLEAARRPHTSRQNPYDRKTPEDMLEL